jgi:hypothetical protein
VTIYRLSDPLEAMSFTALAASSPQNGGDQIQPGTASTHPPAIISFGVLALSALVIIIVLTMYVIGNGKRTLRRALIGRTGTFDSLQRVGQNQNPKTYILDP